MSDWRSFDTVATTYERIATPRHVPMARDLVALVAPPAGGRVLDVGTGTGVAAEAASEATGPEGLVVGVDPSVEMLRFARRRVPRVAAAVAVDLPFRNGAFDAVLVSFVLHFFTRYETALFDLKRVLRHGGRLGSTTWGAGTDEFSRVWGEVAASFLGKDMFADALSRAAPWRERFGDPGRLEETLRDTGFRDVRVEKHRYRSTYTLEEYLADRESSGVGRLVREMLGESLWERFRQSVGEEFRNRFRDPIGDSSDVLVAAATKP